jgi:hypothetical protein
VEAGRAPDITGTETAFKISYISIVVLGAQRLTPAPGTLPLDHVSAIKYLISAGAPIDKEDIVGITSLHIATLGHAARLDIARLLLESGANVNHQDRYGSVPILSSMQTNNIPAVELLLEFGTDLDVAEADDVTPESMSLLCGPQVTSVVQKWKRKRAGQEALREGKTCGNCGTSQSSGGTKLLQCSKCHTMLYCSKSCQSTLRSLPIIVNPLTSFQGSHWKAHKPACQPFASSSNSVVLKPCFRSFGGANGYSSIMPTAEFVRHTMGYSTDANASRHNKATTWNADSLNVKTRSIIIKVQLPVSGTGEMLVYTKKRDLVCTIRPEDNSAAYPRLADVVKSKGVGGMKACFAAELKSKDELVVKVSEVLAEQPF